MGSNWHCSSSSAVHQSWMLSKAEYKLVMSQLCRKIKALNDLNLNALEHSFDPQGMRSNMHSVLPSTYLSCMCFKKCAYQVLKMQKRAIGTESNHKTKASWKDSKAGIV